jgi:hypothetical protein
MLTPPPPAADAVITGAVFCQFFHIVRNRNVEKNKTRNSFTFTHHSN